MRKINTTRFIIIILIAIIFALIVRTIFAGSINLFSIMSVGFLFFVPFGIGAITVALSKYENVKKFAYSFFVPWLPILGFFILTIAFSIEGFACWLMILPVFLIAASIGGITVRYFKLKKRRKPKDELTFVSIIVLLPFLISPIEHYIEKIPGTYTAYTFIDIKASKENIWSNVTRVREIKPDEDKGWLSKTLGLPRPIKAELNYEGVGAYRSAIFSKGLIFHETVTYYSHQKKMVFSIKANPYEIPSTTMDKHILIGGDYFDVLEGTYELQQLNDSVYRLHLYSHFILKTDFNFYASWWAGKIMKDIQYNILQIIKIRSQSKLASFNS